MKKAKLVLLILCAVAGLALLVQNDQVIDVRVGWMTVQSPLAVLSLAMLIVGFLTGAGVAWLLLSPSQEGKRDEKAKAGTD
ncbi:MAG: hypothetical protein WEB58_12170 [Planctomycetaceae bacterium]